MQKLIMILKKPVTILFLLIASVIAFYFALLQPHPYIVTVDAIEDNCFALLEAVEAYEKTHKAYPQSWRAAIQSSKSFRNPVNSSDSWITEQIVSSKDEALQFAKQAHPGQVIFCPLRVNNKIVDFYIMGVDDRRALIYGFDKPLMLSKDHEHGQPLPNRSR